MLYTIADFAALPCHSLSTEAATVLLPSPLCVQRPAARILLLLKHWHWLNVWAVYF